MRHYKNQIVGILMLVGLFFGIAPFFSTPVQASSSMSIEPNPQPVSPTVCREDITDSVFWMSKYNLIVLENVTDPGFTHVDGATYVRGNYNATGASDFGTQSGPTCSDNTLAISGTVTSGSALKVLNGNAIFGSSPVSSRIAMNSGCTATVNSSFFATSTIKSDLETASTALAAATANNSDPAVDGSGSLIFNVNTVTANGLAIFDVTAAQVFQSAANNQIDFVYGPGITPASTTILVNVSGTTINWTTNASFGNSVETNSTHIIWNLHQATSITFQKQWFGAMLAPKASLNANSQNLTGSIVVKTFTNSGELHKPFFSINNTTPLKDVCGTTTENPGVFIKKYTNGEDADSATGPIIAAGSQVTWTYDITNTGNVSLTLVVTDNIPSVTPSYVSGDSNSNGKLDVNEKWTYRATGTAISGQYANTGYVVGTSPEHTKVTDNDPSHYFGATPGIVIKKYTNGDDADDETGPIVPAGSLVTWTYNVTNSGNVALSSIVVTDNVTGVTPTYVSGDTNSNSKLDLDEKWVYTATGTAIIGQYANTGYVEGVSPTNEKVKDNDPSHYFGSNPAIVIKKYTNGEDADTPTGPMIAVGDAVTWTYNITNAGNVPLSNIVVTDNIQGVTPIYVSGDTNTNNKLDLSEKWVYTATGTAVAGQYANTGYVQGTSPSAVKVTDNDPSHYFGEGPGIAIKKYTNGEDADNATGPIVPAGSIVTWTYDVTNTGNAPLTGIQVTDNIQGVTPTYVAGDTDNDSYLDLTEKWTYTATGIAIAGQYANTGTVTGRTDDQRQVTDNDPSHYFGATPGILIKKYTNGEDADGETGPIVPVGSQVTWTYNVTNSGNVPLSSIVVTDNVQGVTPVYISGDTNSNSLLDLDEKWLYTTTGTAIVGQYANTGYVEGVSPTDAKVKDNDPSHYFGANPAIVIKKYTNDEDADSETGPYVPAGSQVTWTYNVTNSGNVPLSSIVVTDNVQGVTPIYVSGDTNSNSLLDLDEKWLYTATGTAIAGQYANTGYVEGTAPTDDKVRDNDPSHYFGANPAIVIKKYTNGEDADSETGPEITVGNAVTWTYNITNAGNVPLSSIVVTDNIQGVTPVYVSGDTNNNGKLDLDEKWLFQATGTAIAGQYANTGTVKGSSPDSRIVTDDDPSHYIGNPPSQPEVAALGDRVWNDLNANGVQENGEVGVPGVTVKLLEGDCSSATGLSTTTDSNGIYRFSDLEPGSYCVQFDLTTLPNGFKVSPQNVGDDALDSDGNTTTGKTASVTLAGGAENLTLDLGIYQPAALGDRVWVDSNKNGAQDDGEANLPGVTVTLFNSNNQPVGAAQVTDINGYYLFTGLVPGSYYVVFDSSSLPIGTSFTTANAVGVSEAKDSDAGDGGKTATVTLSAGQVYRDLDAGIVEPDEPQPQLAALGDTVWYDLNKNGLQEDGEAGVPGVKVDLYAGDDSLISTTITSSTGKYLFSNLQPGTYYVVFAGVNGYTFTHYDVSANSQDALDSDALAPWIEVTTSDGGAEAQLGEPLTYTISYSNTDATLAATNLVFSATVPAGTTFDAAASTNGWSCTDTTPGSVCTLTVATLAANSSSSATFTVTLDDNSDVVPDALDLFVSVSQGAAARSSNVTLAAGESNLTVDAGVVTIEANLTVPTPTAPTNLPDGDQPDQQRVLFLPSVASHQ